MLDAVGVFQARRVGRRQAQLEIGVVAVVIIAEAARLALTIEEVVVDMFAGGAA